MIMAPSFVVIFFFSTGGSYAIYGLFGTTRAKQRFIYCSWVGCLRSLKLCMSFYLVRLLWLYTDSGNFASKELKTFNTLNHNYVCTEFKFHFAYRPCYIFNLHANMLTEYLLCACYTLSSYTVKSFKYSAVLQFVIIVSHHLFYHFAKICCL